MTLHDALMLLTIVAVYAVGMGLIEWSYRDTARRMDEFERRTYGEDDE